MSLSTVDSPENAGEDKERKEEDDDGDNEVVLCWSHFDGGSKIAIRFMRDAEEAVLTVDD